MPFNLLLEGGGILRFGVKNDVATGDERLYVVVAKRFEQGTQLIHFHEVTTDIDGPQECDILWHHSDSGEEPSRSNPSSPGTLRCNHLARSSDRCAGKDPA